MWFLGILLIIALVVAGWYARLWIREWIKSGDEPIGGPGFALSDLRQLHKSGAMTDEEFERAKSQVIAETHKATAAAASAKAASGSPATATSANQPPHLPGHFEPLPGRDAPPESGGDNAAPGAS